MKKYDAIIIGSGQGGTPLAKKLAEAGLKTALIEKKWAGGTCVNDGCTPTKTMIASAKRAYNIRTSDDLGVEVTDFKINISKIISRQQSIVKSFRESSENALKSTPGLDFIHGEASFASSKTLAIKTSREDNERLSADLIIIDTGTHPFVPDIAGLTFIPYLTSTTILDLEELPEHLLIVGGGSVALEFGQMYRRFGSKITILERSERILKKEDEDIATEVHNILSEEQIDIKVNAQAVSFRKGDDYIEAEIQVNDKQATISCSHVLIATGRKPNTNNLNLSAAGVSINESNFIKVDNQLQTNVAGIYAIGDVNGGPAFTHISYHDHLIVYNNIVHMKNETTDHRIVPYCMYIDPQLGRVGITAQDATHRNIDVQVATLKMASVARAIETNQTRGLMKVVVDSKSKKILGASILGAEGGEIMSVLEIAMLAGVTYDVIKDTIFAHPTYAESLNNLFATLDKQS